MTDARRYVVVCLLLALVGGCARWHKRRAVEPPSLLRPAAASPESVTLEIFFVRVPFADPQANVELWQSVDEQQLPVDLRRDLARNGFRAGMVGGQVPAQLSELMHLTDEPPPVAEQQQQTVPLDTEPTVRRRVLQLRSGRRGEVLASPLYPTLPLLVCEGGDVRGKTFQQAQGLFGLHAHPQPDGRVRLSLVPEVHHGEARQQWNGQDGMLQFEMARPKESFETLQIDTLLTSGQMLLVTCLPDRPGSLGHHFFHDQSARGEEQKLLIIRLVTSPTQELYGE